MAQSFEERDDGRLDAREVASDPPEDPSRPVLDEGPASRRDFLKQAAVGALGSRWMLAGAAGLGAAAAASGCALLEGRVHDDFPVSIREGYAPVDQRRTVFTFASSRKLNAQHPERARKFAGFDFHEKLTQLGKERTRGKPGYTQLDRALDRGAVSTDTRLAPGERNMLPNRGVGSWDQSGVADERYEFESPEQADLALKSAARLYQATRCGITRRDRRWDYDPLYDWELDRPLSWEKDFPFEPKTVIVMLFEMDYKTVSASPTWTSVAASSEGYSMAIKAAGQMAVFLRELGYHAVAAGNDLGMSVPYAVAAGLGEGARNGTLIAPALGPRLRISKVYTDLEFVAYDMPRSFGITSFCANCKRCADSCPSQAITQDDEPSWGPTYAGADDPDVSWSNNAGVLKYHNDAKKCFRFWTENDHGCTNCITSCPYNKPDFWHHRFVDVMNVVSPGPLHALMREMDIWFGYGTTFDGQAVKNFWRSGKNMRGG
jgi:reductive dehalogenase